MRDVTKFPHAEGSAPIARKPEGDPISWPQQQAISVAFTNAEHVFVAKYDRKPDYDIVRFRGCTSTVHCVVELWEEE